MNLLDIDEVMALANGEPSARVGLNAKTVARANVMAMNMAIENLQLSYALLYLQAKTHCDDFHEGKNSFSDLGERYGYINSWVRMDKGTIDARFGYRRPLPSGTLERKTLNRGSGYTRASFKRAAHEYEVELCLMTEEHYSLLISTGKQIKKLIRKIRDDQFRTRYSKLK